MLKNNVCNRPPLNGLVLAGGRSSRMGEDKGMLCYYSKSQREHVYDMLSLHCEAVFISCNKEQTSLVEHLPIIEDGYDRIGPLGGILSAFHHNPNAAWFIVACDMPFLQEATLTHLLQHRNPLKIATAFWNEEETFPESLVSIWEPASFTILLSAFGKGYGSPGKILLHNNAELITAPNAAEFNSVNTSAEYDSALRRINNNSSD